MTACTLACLWLAGCTGGPWSVGKPPAGAATATDAAPGDTPAGDAPSAAVAPSETADSPDPAASKASSAAARAGAPPSSGEPSPEELQEVMAELNEVGAVDPDARDRLMDDLRQVDPALWPLMLRQFRAALAFRRRAESDGPETSGARADLAVNAGGAAGRRAGTPLGSLDEGFAPRRADSAVSPASYNERVRQPRELPSDVSSGASGADSPSGGLRTLPERPRASTAPPSPASGAWQDQLVLAARTMESQLGERAASEEGISDQARLRMVYLLAGRRDEAMRPLVSAPPAVQDFWTKQLYGLSTWLDAERTPDGQRRAAEAKQLLGEALDRLGEAAPLVVRNLAFCTEIQSYGCVTRFPGYTFEPDQEVLLYAEVENFASEPTPKGYHTSLRSSYQVFDARGQRVAEHEFSVTEEYCQNPRRDFFIVYHLRLPERIYPGKHTLQLFIEDLNRNKVGQSSIEFTIGDGSGGGGGKPR